MQKQQNYEIIELDWDTNFFGIKSAKINLNNVINEKHIEEINNEVRKKEYKFITINNKNNDDKNNFILQKLDNIFLADVNIQFLKKIEDKKIIEEENIKIQNNLKYEKQLLEIAKENFIYSRFYNDRNLKNSKDIYLEWTRNAFEKTNKYFCVYEQEKKILGYLLFSIEDNHLIIELIAINAKEQSKRNRDKINPKNRIVCNKKRYKRNTGRNANK